MSRLRLTTLSIAAAALLAVPTAAIGQCTDCEDDTETLTHVAPYDHQILLGWYGPGHDWSVRGYCITTHVAGCGGLATELSPEVFVQLASLQGDELEDLLHELGERVEFNRERNALQIRGCDTDSYIAHIPVRDSQRAAVARAFETTQSESLVGTTDRLQSVAGTTMR